MQSKKCRKTDRALRFGIFHLTRIKNADKSISGWKVIMTSQATGFVETVAVAYKKEDAVRIAKKMQRDRSKTEKARIGKLVSMNAHRAVTTPEQRSEIRNLYAAGRSTMPQLAKKYGVARSTIRRIIREVYFAGEGNNQNRG